MIFLFFVLIMAALVFAWFVGIASAFFTIKRRAPAAFQEYQKAVNGENNETPPGWRTEWRDVDGWENQRQVVLCPHCGWSCIENVKAIFTFCPVCGKQVEKRAENANATRIISR